MQRFRRETQLWYGIRVRGSLDSWESARDPGAAGGGGSEGDTRVTIPSQLLGVAAAATASYRCDCPCRDDDEHWETFLSISRF